LEWSSLAADVLGIPRSYLMIQLATDPTASRTSYRPQGEEPGKAQAQGFEAQRGRSGHAWPFLSRQPIRPSRQDSQKPTSSDNGS
jgi:hypothetical protein